MAMHETKTRYIDKARFNFPDAAKIVQLRNGLHLAFDYQSEFNNWKQHNGHLLMSAKRAEEKANG